LALSPTSHHPAATKSKKRINEEHPPAPLNKRSRALPITTKAATTTSARTIRAASFTFIPQSTLQLFFGYSSSIFPLSFDYLSTIFRLSFDYSSTILRISFDHFSTTYRSTIFRLSFHHSSAILPPFFGYPSAIFSHSREQILSPKNPNSRPKAAKAPSKTSNRPR
jgi:hypothetical protein